MKTYLTFGILILCALLVTNVANLGAAEKWQIVSELPTQRTGFATAVVDGKIYLIGGTPFQNRRVPMDFQLLRCMIQKRILGSRSPICQRHARILRQQWSTGHSMCAGAIMG